jgi:hypothetical protein
LVYTYNFHFVYFMAVWLILWTIWYIFPVLVCCTKKNLATLIASQNLLPSSSSQPNQLFLRNLIVKSCQGVRPTLKLLSLPRISFTSPMQGCQIFICSKLPKRQKYNKWPQTIPNGHKLYQMVIKYSKWSYVKYTNIYHSKALQKFTQIWNFGFENKPSGNSAQKPASPGW